MKNPIIDEAIERILRAESPLSDTKLDGLTAAWRFEATHEGERGPVLEDVVRADAAIAARTLALELTKVSQTPAMLPGHERFYGEGGALIIAWTEAAARDPEAILHPIFVLALEALQAPSRIVRSARARVKYGPPADALACLAFAGQDAWLFESGAAAIEARVEMMFWQAAGSAMIIPALGRWLWSNDAAFQTLFVRASRGTLRHRALAARIASVAADGFEWKYVHPSALGQTTRVIRALAAHPEPLVWIPAAIAMGRLAARNSDIHALLTQGLQSTNIGERRRAITALAATKADGRSLTMDQAIEDVLKDGADVWSVASLGPAIPYLALDRRDIYEMLIAKVEKGTLGVELDWSATRGLLALARRSSMDRITQRLLLRLRSRAMEARPKAPTAMQLWLDIRADTDHLVGADPDPKDLDLLLERAVANAISLGAEQLWPRAADLAREIGPTFQTAFTRAKTQTEPEALGGALRIAESCATAAALAWWQPIARAAGRDPSTLDREAAADRQRMFDAASTALSTAEPEFAVHRLSLRVLGYLADATDAPESRGVASERDRRAAAIASIVAGLPWMAKEVGKRRFEKTIADTLWRSLDATRSSGVHSPQVLVQRFAAWWAVSCPKGQLLDLLRRSEAGSRLDEGTRALIESTEASIRAALDPAAEGAIGGETMPAVLAGFNALNAGDSALASSLAAFGVALKDLDEVRKQPLIDPIAHALRALSDVAARLRMLTASPELALAEPIESEAPDDPIRDLITASLDALSKPDQDTLLVPKRWATGLGPVLAPILEKAVERALPFTSKPEVPAASKSPDRIGPYTLKKCLKTGGEGEAWLVEKDNQRMFVMKLVHSRFLSKPADEREKILANLVREGETLKRIYHANVANFFDSGVEDGRPYLVMEYLVGCDLETYAAARLLTVEELKPIVVDVANGLRALHGAGLVHCDLKPGNIFLRLDLPPGEKFDPARHRDPNDTPVLAAVVIDFGITRAAAGTNVTGEDEFGGGTVGYISPEQVAGRLHRNTDVYALAASVYSAMTGRRFFDDNPQLFAWLAAHAERDPFDDRSRTEGLPKKLVALLKDATFLSPEARPDAKTFAARMNAL